MKESWLNLLSSRRTGDDSESNCEDREPCARNILEVELLKNFKMPEMTMYTDDTDSSDHLSRFNRVMTVMKVSNDAKFLYFPLTLGGSKEEWFKKLEPGSMDCITLPAAPQTSGMPSVKFQATPRCSLNFVIELAHYDYGLSVSGPTPKACTQYLAQFASLAASATSAPETSQSKWSSKGSTQSDSKKPKRYEYNPKYSQYIDLVDTQERVYLTARQNVHYQRPPPLYRDRSRRDPNKRCECHNDIGHTTNKCKNLKDEIENLIRLDHLYEWIRNRLSHMREGQVISQLPRGSMVQAPNIKAP
uniref:Uncharacterized protein n=1 Tax=Cannabis sativa TaxID=3483 RepID=A0A803Q568_CANSA